MRLPATVVEECTVRPGQPAGLVHRSTEDTATDWLGAGGLPAARHLADHDLDSFRRRLADAQQRLWASGTWAVLVILQGVDASGKDGTIGHVLSGVNPQGCTVTSFREPSTEELAHDFLWRCVRALPARGSIGIFNRSWYEEVLVTRVHPELLDAERLPPGAPAGDELWRQRYEDIAAFERHLVRNGTHLVKIHLHLSAAEQRRRLLARLDDPAKQWKFSEADLAEHRRLADYRVAYEAALTATSTPWAPWRVVPADHKHALRALVGGILVHDIEQLPMAPPAPGPGRAAELAAARRALAAEEA